MIRSLATCQIPVAQTTSKPSSVISVTVGENSDQTRLTRSLTARFRSLAARKRAISRFSCANALTTRMPGMVSVNTLLISPQLRSTFSNPCLRRSRTRWIVQAMKGNGTRVTSASFGSIDTRIAAVIKIINTSLVKSSRCNERNTQIRSLSLPILAIRSPVRLDPKYSRDSDCKCANAAVLRSAPIRSLTRASSQVRAQPSTQASNAATRSPARYPRT